MRQISILIIGLGRMGGRFFDKLSEVGEDKVKIIAVCETNEDAPKVSEVKAKGIEHFKNYADAIAKYGDKIDIIMDTSNRPEIKQAIRKTLQESDNHHTVLVPMVVDYLMWYLLNGSEDIPQDHKEIGY